MHDLAETEGGAAGASGRVPRERPVDGSGVDPTGDPNGAAARIRRGERG
ncbi:MAG: hypothetical protein ABEJ26_10415 [Halosimplex sp.]